MNKHLIAAITAMGFALSVGAASAATAFQDNVTLTNTECSLLGESVRLGASAKVHGAYNCNEEANLVQVAACHEGGSRSQGVACVDTDLEQDGVQLPAGCEGTPTPSNSVNPNYKAFYTSSQGGVMQEQELGNRCSATSIIGIEGFSS